jgi:hypothetical protein
MAFLHLELVYLQLRRTVHRFYKTGGVPSILLIKLGSPGLALTGSASDAKVMPKRHLVRLLLISNHQRRVHTTIHRIPNRRFRIPSLRLLQLLLKKPAILSAI